MGQNSGSEKKTVGAKTTIKEGTVRQPILSRMLGKLRANTGETLTEVLISVLVIALGMTMCLSAFLASNAYQTGTQRNYRTGQYPIVRYVSTADSDAEEEEVNLQDLLYRYR